MQLTLECNSLQLDVLPHSDGLLFVFHEQF